MSTMIFVNFPVKNVADATNFYEKKLDLQRTMTFLMFMQAVWSGTKIFISCC